MATTLPSQPTQNAILDQAINHQGFLLLVTRDTTFVTATHQTALISTDLSSKAIIPVENQKKMDRKTEELFCH